ncbi:MAG: hypothetical protein NTW04_02295 [Elusimicrobia bacterium]|nr:hypothetical protein [Elusimicrobiota bacterium]
MKFWAYINNEIKGPYTQEEVLKLPEFDIEILVCPEAMPGEETQEWQPAGKVFEQALPPAPPSAPSTEEEPYRAEDSYTELPPEEQTQKEEAPAPTDNSAVTEQLQSLNREMAEKLEIMAGEISTLKEELQSARESQSSAKEELLEKISQLEEKSRQAIAQKPDVGALGIGPTPKPPFVISPSETTRLKVTPATLGAVEISSPEIKKEIEPPVQKMPEPEPLPAQTKIDHMFTPALSQPPTQSHPSEGQLPIQVTSKPVAPIKKRSGTSRKIFNFLMLAVFGVALIFLLIKQNLLPKKYADMALNILPAKIANMTGLKKKEPPKAAPEQANSKPQPVAEQPKPAPAAKSLADIVVDAKAYKITPEMTLEQAVTALVSPENLRLVEWNAQMLNDTLYSVSIKTPPASPSDWVVIYRFDYNLTEKTLSPSNNDAALLLKSPPVASGTVKVSEVKAPPAKPLSIKKKPAISLPSDAETVEESE